VRAVADEVGDKAASYREREGQEPALIPERVMVMVCMSSNAMAPRVLPHRRPHRRAPPVRDDKPSMSRRRAKHRAASAPRMPARSRRNIHLAANLGATVIRVRADGSAEGLIALAQREGVTHVIFGQNARSRWELLWRGSTLHRSLGAVPDAAVQVVPRVQD
jgi:two-component system sensor histidine kinase KdpD